MSEMLSSRGEPSHQQRSHLLWRRLSGQIIFFGKGYSMPTHIYRQTHTHTWVWFWTVRVCVCLSSANFRPLPKTKAALDSARLHHVGGHERRLYEGIRHKACRSHRHLFTQKHKCTDTDICNAHIVWMQRHTYSSPAGHVFCTKPGFYLVFLCVFVSE